jgi:hypothetical protein
VRAYAAFVGAVAVVLVGRGTVAAQDARPAGVRVKAFVAVGADSGNFNVLSFDYAFPDQREVVISGVGRAPPIGHLRFLTAARELQITSGNNQVLATVPLERPTRMLAPDASDLDLPQETDFPLAEQVYRIPAPEPPTVRIDDTLNELFPHGHRIFRRSTDTCWLTTYSLVPTKSATLRVEAAALISASILPNNLTEIRVRFRARERRTRTAWRTTLSTEASDVAHDFLARIETALGLHDKR